MAFKLGVSCAAVAIGREIRMMGDRRDDVADRVVEETKPVFREDGETRWPPTLQARAGAG